MALIWPLVGRLGRPQRVDDADGLGAADFGVDSSRCGRDRTKRLLVGPSALLT